MSVTSLDGTEMQSSWVLFSMFITRRFVADAAKRCSALRSLNKRWLICPTSYGTTEMFLNFSRSQYLTVPSDTPFASAKF